LSLRSFMDSERELSSSDDANNDDQVIASGGASSISRPVCHSESASSSQLHFSKR
jgi:hypothetical protein